MTLAEDRAKWPGGRLGVPAPSLRKLGTYRAGRDSGSAPVMVFITKSGARYHRQGCRYLRTGGVPTPLEEVKADGRYRPCTVCRPPK
jgi:hypothetical protein